jgi:hypothetical protein
MRSTWTDSRLDDLTHRMDDGFARVDKDLREIRAEIVSVRSELSAEIGSVRSELSAEVSAVRTELSAEIGAVRTELSAETGSLRLEMNARFDSLQRTLLQFGGGLVASFVALIAAFVLTGH